MNSNPIIFITGPTAIGKSEVAFLLAKQLGGEIISCDSVQIYNEINIVSNKPSQSVLNQIPHHLINVVSVEDYFDVVKFNQLALESLKQIQSRNKVPIIVGGSGMYMQVLLDGIFDGPPRNEELRKRLQAQADQEGNEALYQQLLTKDPEAARKFHPNDTKRIIRALEVLLQTGEPISQLQKQHQGLWGSYDIHLFGLNRDRQQLYEMINARTEEMFAQGLVEEIRSLQGRSLTATVQRIIGIKEVQGFLNKEYDLERAKYLMKLNTRHFAKRQWTWFRREDRIEWIELEQFDGLDSVVEGILDHVGLDRNGE